LFVFEGSIIATDNKLNHGVSANSNSNINLDRSGLIYTKNNGLDGIQLENSLLNMFNMPSLPASNVTASQFCFSIRVIDIARCVVPVFLFNYSCGVSV
jgi:hypothetical protein